MMPYTGFPLEVGLQKILSLLEAEDADVRIHAVKVVANLAAEGFFLQSSSVDFFDCYHYCYHFGDSLYL